MVVCRTLLAFFVSVYSGALLYQTLKVLQTCARAKYACNLKKCSFYHSAAENRMWEEQKNKLHNLMPQSEPIAKEYFSITVNEKKSEPPPSVSMLDLWPSLPNTPTTHASNFPAPPTPTEVESRLTKPVNSDAIFQQAIVQEQVKSLPNPPVQSTEPPKQEILVEKKEENYIECTTISVQSDPKATKGLNERSHPS